MPQVDLRSDTVTQPTAAMREAMARAEVGDDVFGDDPTVNALQDTLARQLGYAAGLFVPTGTQSNLCALMAHCQRGDEYIVGQMAHTYRWEGGGAAVLGSIQPQPLAHQADGTLALADIEAAIKPDDPHFARSRLLSLENTLGGVVLPLDYLGHATELAHSRGLATHLDGARLLNAAVAQTQARQRGEPANSAQSGHVAPVDTASDAPVSEIQLPTNEAVWAQARRIVAGFDSVSVCLSKGLGAPVGSVLCGSREFIARAHRVRKMAGGGMRQAGVLAAAGLYALQHHLGRLAHDHALAARLAAGLQGLPGVQVQPPQSNMVFIDLDGPARQRAPALLTQLATQGVRATGLYRLRLVRHLDVDAAGVDHAVAVLRHLLTA
jgi:threonine aldolase